MAYRDPEVGRARDRERFRRTTAERVAQGLCPKCGKAPPEPDRSLCAACNEKRRIADRARRARRSAAGIKRVREPKARQGEYRRARARADKRLAQGLCARCARHPPEPQRRLCARCAEKRRASARARYAAARAAGKLYGGRNPAGRRRIARGAKQAAPPCSARRRPVYALRAPASRRGQHRLRAMPGRLAPVRSRAVRRQARRGAVPAMRTDNLRRRLPVRALRRAR